MTLRDRSTSLALRTYKLLLSPVLHTLGGAGGACRFHPTCSEYAAIAVREHGWLRGAGMALWRVLRCQPFCRGGFDPVPPKKADSISHPQSKALHRAH